nr:unnamed protein product [Digitaria exilis]
MESKATTDDLPTSLAAASFPLLVYDHGEQPDNRHTMLSITDGSSRVYRVSELTNCSVNGGGDAWISQPYDIGFYPFVPDSDSHLTKMAISNIAAVDGKFYFMETRHEVGVLSLARDDPEPPHLEISSFGAVSPTFTGEALRSTTMTYLLESSGDLFLVCLFFIGCDFEHVEEVCAYKMDFSERQWCKVTDIGDRVFLLGAHSFAASCSAAKHGLKRGCVYFAFDFFGDSNDFHIFDLLNGTRELTGPAQDVPLHASEPFWMVPVLP